jgi:nucleoside 2-deoxyribosyltransferase
MSRNGHVYLAGAIEFSPDKGNGWRTEAAKKLEEAEFSSFNPCSDEGNILKRHGFLNHFEFHESKMTDFKRFVSCMRDMIKVDMAQVALSDAVLLYVDEQMEKASGTVGEVTAAFHLYQTPVYAVIKPGVPLTNISGWMLACVHKTFSNMDEAIEAIRKDQKRY